LHRASSAESTAATSDSYQDALLRPQPSKLFVGGLHQLTTTKQLRTHFSRYGQVMDCIAMRRQNGTARGFGYVTVGTLEAAELCISEPQCIDGRAVVVKHAVPPTRSRKKAHNLRQVRSGELTLCPKCCGGSRKSPPSDRCAQPNSPTAGAWTDSEAVRGSAWMWAEPGAWGTMSPSIWSPPWRLDAMTEASTAALYVAPPPGLPAPRGMSRFRTPSSSECSSRCSSPARSEG